MPQAVSHWPLTEETGVPTRVIPCGNCVGQCGTGTGFSPVSSIFPVNTMSPSHFTLIHNLGDEQ
jgi:hypothetical protein